MRTRKWNYPFWFLLIFFIRFVFYASFEQFMQKIHRHLLCELFEWRRHARWHYWWSFVPNRSWKKRFLCFKVIGKVLSFRNYLWFFVLKMLRKSHFWLTSDFSFTRLERWFLLLRKRFDGGSGLESWSDKWFDLFRVQIALENVRIQGQKWWPNLWYFVISF